MGAAGVASRHLSRGQLPLTEGDAKKSCGASENGSERQRNLIDSGNLLVVRGLARREHPQQIVGAPIRRVSVGGRAYRPQYLLVAAAVVPPQGPTPSALINQLDGAAAERVAKALETRAVPDKPTLTHSQTMETRPTQ